MASAIQLVRTLALAGAALLATQASAEAFNGFYVGAQAGWQQDAGNKGYGDYKGDGFTYGGFLGYNFNINGNGIIGLETAVPLALDLVRDGVVDAGRMVALMALNPAAILGLGAGRLDPGAMADVTIIDPEREFVYTADQVVSKSRNTPFLGWRLKGRAVLTMVGGEVRYRLPG